MTKPVAKFQHIALTGSFLAITSLTMASPVMAANPFSNFTQSLRDRLNRVYFMLPGDKSGESVMAEAGKVMDQMKTAAMEVKADMKLTDKTDQSLMTGNIILAGPVEIKDVYDPTGSKQDLNVKGEMSMQGVTVRASADFKIDGKIVYVKVTELPGMAMMKNIQNQWLKIDPDKMKTEDEMMGDDANETAEKELTAEQRQQMEDAYTDLVKSSQISTARKEELNGHKVFVVDLNVRDQAVLDYLKRIAEIQKQSTEEIDSQMKSVKQFLDATDDLKVTLWIDRSSFFVRQMTLPMTMDMQKILAAQKEAARQQLIEAGYTEAQADRALTSTSSSSASPFGPEEDLKSMVLNFTATMDKFNEPVNFQAPTDAKDFQEAMGGLSSGAVQGMFTTQPSPDQPKVGGARPSELPQLSPEEKRLLKEYGVEVENL